MNGIWKQRTERCMQSRGRLLLLISDVQYMTQMWNCATCLHKHEGLYCSRKLDGRKNYRSDRMLMLCIAGLFHVKIIGNAWLLPLVTLPVKRETIRTQPTYIIYESLVDLLL